ncbi:hypothetical protein Q8G38_00145 [Halomonas venusta]|uniref:hypothetical protein n=1 Tax=Vreelandella venusta TaxID=44935 RepID=UPI00295F062E|nr:hypothetical protein [Halomonas venusta]MDW0357719.1 hypothetical protein [Halomonas venusta]
MIITIKPQVRDTRPTFEVEGDALIIDGDKYDFSPLPDGAILPEDAIGSEWFPTDVKRVNDTLHITLIVPFSPWQREVLTGQKIVIENPADGPLPLPEFVGKPEHKYEEE